MKIDVETIFSWCLLIMLCIVGIGGISLLGYAIYTDNQNDSYCALQYPSEDNMNTVSETHMVEEGYIKCCRHYYNNHEIEKECKIFERYEE